MTRDMTDFTANILDQHSRTTPAATAGRVPGRASELAPGAPAALPVLVLGLATLWVSRAPEAHRM
jgi:hypothetical protein